MSTAVAEITRVLPRLSNEELRDLERAILQTYRQRGVGILFDDAYGIFTEQDLVTVCEEALQVVEQAPSKP